MYSNETIHPSFQTKDVAFEFSTILCYQMLSSDRYDNKAKSPLQWRVRSHWKAVNMLMGGTYTRGELTCPIRLISPYSILVPCSASLASGFLVLCAVGVGGEWLFEWERPARRKHLKATERRSDARCKWRRVSAKAFWGVFFVFDSNVSNIYTHKHTHRFVLECVQKCALYALRCVWMVYCLPCVW